MVNNTEQVIRNVELRWCYLKEPNTKGEFPSNKYQVTIVFDKDTKKVIEGMKNSKQDIKDLGEGKYSITLKSTKPIKVVQGPLKTLVEGEALGNIGNGTIATVKVNQFTTPKFGTFLGIKTIRIDKLVEYADDLDFGDDDVLFDTDEDNDLDEEAL